MIALMALALLAAVALLLLRPEGVVATSLRKVATDHPRIIIGIATLMGTGLCIGGLWPSPERRETDVQGYGELWHMVQTAPELRDAARARMADGILTGDELQEMREKYRQASDLDDMRKGVAQELAR